MKKNTYKLSKITQGIVLITSIGIMALNTQAEESAEREDFRPLQGSYVTTGLLVTDSEGHKIGRIKDVALDVENARLVEVIVSSGGFAGIGQKLIAVPPKTLTYDSKGRVMVINMSKDRFKSAPGFEMSKWAEHTESKNVAKAYRYFGQEPYFAADGNESKSGNTSVEPLGHVERASKLQGLPVKNLQNEFLGNVTTFFYTMQRARISHIIVTAPGFLKTKSVIPSKGLKFNDKHDGFYYNVTMEAFRNEPRFKWDYKGDGGFQQETYVNTKVEDNGGVNTKQNVREGIAGTYTPLAQGATFDDIDKTYRIYHAMRADESLSRNAQNVEVGTLNNRTTLRGHVNTQENKDTIGQIATKAGLAENVTNLIEVRPLPVK